MIRFRALLTAALAVVLVPVLVVTAGPASAVTLYGPSVAFSFEHSAGVVANYSCSARAYWSANTASGVDQVVVKGKCSKTFASPTPQLDLFLVGADEKTGAACGAVVLPSSDEVFTESGFSNVGTLTGGDDCRVSVVRWAFDSDSYADPFSGFQADGEEVADLGVPSTAPSTMPASGTCPQFSVLSVEQLTYNAAADGGPAGGQGLKFRVRFGGVSQYIPYVRVVPYVRRFNEAFPGGSQVDGFVGDFNSLNPATPSSLTVTQSLGFYVGDDRYDLVGVQILSQTGALPPVQVTEGGNGVSAGTIRKATGPQHWLGGSTWPAVCAFYFGEQIATDPPGVSTARPAGALDGVEGDGQGNPGGGGGGTPDEPDDPVDEPPDPTPNDGCGFSVTDPSTWGGAAACVVAAAIGKVVAILGQLLSSITGLPAKVVNLFKAMFQGLLVPSDGFIAGKINQVKSAWAGTPPGVLLGTFVELPSQFSAATAAGSCAGPDMPLSFGMFDGATINPLSTCEEGTARIARIAYIGMQVTLWVSTVVLCFRILGAAIGFAPPVGSKGDGS